MNCIGLLMGLLDCFGFNKYKCINDNDINYDSDNNQQHSIIGRRNNGSSNIKRRNRNRNRNLFKNNQIKRTKNQIKRTVSLQNDLNLSTRNNEELDYSNQLLYQPFINPVQDFDKQNEENLEQEQEQEIKQIPVGKGKPHESVVIEQYIIDNKNIKQKFFVEGKVVFPPSKTLTFVYIKVSVSLNNEYSLKENSAIIFFM